MIAFFKSFQYAIQGVRAAWHGQRNLKIQCFAAVMVIVAGVYFEVTSTEWCILLLCIALVLGFEMINTAIENIVNLVTLERNPLAGKIKDIAAGAVLVVSLITAIVGIVIFKQYLFQ